MTTQKNVSLDKYSTLRVGGPARFFVSVESLEDLQEAVAFAREENVPFFVLGGGSNVYFKDEGFSGLVISIEMQGVTYESHEDGSVLVRAEAGVDWDGLVAETVGRGLWGLENLSLIPGTVGASPVQNIGAYGQEVKNVITEVEAFDTERLQTVVFSNEECQFAYRDSFFKTKAGRKYIVTAVTFKLSESEQKNISYHDLQEYFHETGPQASLRDVREAVVRIRQKKLPDPDEVGTLGSFFKNPIVSKEKYRELQSTFLGLTAHETEDGYKLSAAWLIDKACDLKGYREGALGTYETQPLALVNYGGASAGEVEDFARKIKNAVHERTGVLLEEEVLCVGER